MTDKFSLLPIDSLLRLILNQLDSKTPVFGISHQLFFQPEKNDSFRQKLFGTSLETPIGVAAGPHSQLTQNIIAAWLTGARFIELKTIQTLDELAISKPCIDMQDEGYNCEWSQELKIRESFDQYLNGWLIIHILRHKLFGLASGDPGVLFNMSVGYDFNGIQQANVQWYLDQMKDASDALEDKIRQVKTIYPEVSTLEINPEISNNITLSTMHGCPPEEIESIGNYLLEERGLHTNIKLNPTLLGPEKLNSIMRSSGFNTQVPDEAFNHDLKYEDARGIIQRLSEKAAKKGLQFGLKLTNTLESRNHKNVFGNEEMMYMSGRALHPIAINLAARLQNEFNGSLNISFSGGANAGNICALYHSGLIPVTVCTDLLKPGGYGRLAQYIENLRKCDQNISSTGQQDFLQQYALQTLKNKAYKRTQIMEPDLKTNEPLGYFDCIQAPCVTTCPTHQDIPNYLHYASEGEFSKAYEIIKDTNPFPLTTGMICDHLCQTKCVRIHYDSPLLIREVKRFVAEYGRDMELENGQKAPSLKKRIAIIGAGPSGLSCAWFLAKQGMEVNIFEAKKDPGGMISHAIPSFRLSDEAIRLDIETIRAMGISIHYDQAVDKTAFEKLRKEYDYVYIGAGAQLSARLNIDGNDVEGILDPLPFLFDVKAGSRPKLGKHIVIIGGGNTAMDAARTAWRLASKDSVVSILYRRTIQQMPADQGEIRAVLDEGIQIIELVSPTKIISQQGRIKAIKCQKMVLGPVDASGRQRPVPVDDEYLEFPADTLIPAIGQQRAFDFLEELTTQTEGSYQSQIPGVYLGGDALRGASTAINAIGDGRLAAEEILHDAGLLNQTNDSPKRKPQKLEKLLLKKARKHPGMELTEPVDHERSFEVLSKTMTRTQVQEEASRCLQCDEFCSLCVSVCPNLAFHTYAATPGNYSVQQIVKRNGTLHVDDLPGFEIRQKYQILHIADWCNHCGNCTTFCPSSGSPYLDKPHLYLDWKVFHAEKDGFFLETGNSQPTIYGYREHNLYSLTLDNKEYIYKAPNAEFLLNRQDLSVVKVLMTSSNSHEDTRMAVILYLVLQGSLDFFAFDTNLHL